MLKNSRTCFSGGSEAPQAVHHTRTLLEDPKADKSIFKIQKYPEVYKTSMKIHLIPGYPATSEFLRSRIAIIARIPGYIYPDISPDTIHQPVSQLKLVFGRGGNACGTLIVHTKLTSTPKTHTDISECHSSI